MDTQLAKAFLLLKQYALQQKLLTYREFALAMGLNQPPVIQQASRILEALMDLNVQAGQPVFSALVVQKKGDIPRPGFFEKLVELGIAKTVLSGEAASRWHRKEREKISLWVKENAE